MIGPGDADEAVRPTHDDPVLAGLSDVVGGPSGAHSAGHRWWTPLRVMMLVTAVCFVVGMVQKSPCVADDWQNNQGRYDAMCYSDLPYLYTGRGFAELAWPYDPDPQVRARYQAMEYPPVISYVAWGTAWAAQALTGGADVAARGDRPVDELWGTPEVTAEIRMFVALSAILFALSAMLATWFAAGVNRNRPWDALGFAAAPALALTGLVNWDLLAVALVAGALWAWSRDRPVLTGVLIGLGTATKLYPLFLLGGILVICLRRRRLDDVGRAVVAAVGAWVLANAPAFVSGAEQWKVFWTFNSDRGADLGSVWMAASMLGGTATAHQINVASWIFFGLWCVAVLMLGLRAPRTPRLAQLGFLIVAGFLLVNKVYSPQYVLWLLPLAVLARPRWRDLLIWQAGEVFYFCCVWWYLGGQLSAGSTDTQPLVYVLAIVVRLAAQLYLVAVVTRDVLHPWEDPVERPDEFYANETRSNPVVV